MATFCNQPEYKRKTNYMYKICTMALYTFMYYKNHTSPTLQEKLARILVMSSCTSSVCTVIFLHNSDVNNSINQRFTSLINVKKSGSFNMCMALWKFMANVSIHKNSHTGRQQSWSLDQTIKIQIQSQTPIKTKPYKDP